MTGLHLERIVNSGEAGRTRLAYAFAPADAKAMHEENAALLCRKGLGDAMKTRHVVCMFLLACAGLLVFAKTGGRP